jgi:GGDEF domain-containing protein
MFRVIRFAIERQKLQDAVRSLAFVDDLTGLFNRRGFFTLAEHHLKLAERMHKNFYLIFSDVDDMKKINDVFGHLQGDLVLKKWPIYYVIHFAIPILLPASEVMNLLF